MVKTKHLFVSAIVFGLISGAALAQSKDALVGTWKLNAAKSTGLPYKSGTSKIEPAGAGVKFTVDLVGADGKVNKWAFTANYDGKDNPVTGQQSIRRCRGFRARRREHDTHHQQTRRESHDHSDHRRVRRWEDTDHDHQGHGRERAEASTPFPSTRSSNRSAGVRAVRLTARTVLAALARRGSPFRECSRTLVGAYSRIALRIAIQPVIQILFYRLYTPRRRNQPVHFALSSADGKELHRRSRARGRVRRPAASTPCKRQTRPRLRCRGARRAAHRGRRHHALPVWRECVSLSHHARRVPRRCWAGWRRLPRRGGRFPASGHRSAARWTRPGLSDVRGFERSWCSPATIRATRAAWKQVFAKSPTPVAYR